MQSCRIRFFRTASMCLMVLIVLVSFCVRPTYAVTLNQAKTQQQALELQKKKNDLLLSEYKNNTQKKSEYKKAIDEQINIVQKQIDDLIVRTKKLDSQIKINENEKNKLLKNGITSSADVAKIINNLKILYMVKSDFDVLKVDLQNKGGELTELYAESDLLLKEATIDEEYVKAEAKRIEKEQDETDKAVDDWYAEYKEAQIESGAYSAENLGGDIFKGTGDFIWPIPGYTTITQYFGGEHRGLDISGEEIYGKSIVASAKGTVAYSGWMGSYGYVVFIDHGNGYQTRYAHMSALGCKVGDTVDAEQIIGYIGSTGNSTGPHLHFEIIYDGNINNPFDYF